jgi:hypothetical protein
VAKTQPTIIKVGGRGAYVNLNNCVSLSVVDNQLHTKLRDGYEGDPSQATAEDLVQYRADTLSFYFIGKEELVLRAGMEISQEEYVQAKAIIEEVTYKLANERITATSETS